jgi:RNA polymerase sigma factor (sigma-70 family)
VRRAFAIRRGATFRPRRPLRAVTLVDHLPTEPRRATARHLLEDYGRGGRRGRELRARLAREFRHHDEDEIEDAVQTACRCFLDEAPGITDPGAADTWIHTAAYRAMLREVGRRGRSVPDDPIAREAKDAALVDDGPGPAEELIDLEDTSELEILVRQVASSLSDQRREIFRLWASGLKRPEIATELGVSEKVVKRGLEDVMRRAREVVAEKAGGGCAEEESVVLRFVCGLADAAEVIRARAHLERCGRCSSFAEQLEAWREKAGVVLGPAAAEVAQPGLVGRSLARAGEALSSARRHVLGGATQAKQQVTAGYARAVDPTPLAGIRPSAVAAVVAGCLAVGTGAATYCAQEGVDPLTAAAGLIRGSGEEAKEEEPPAKEPEAATEPVESPAGSPVVPVYETAEEAPVTETSPVEKEEHRQSSGSEAETRKEAEPEPGEITPPPEQSFEPSSPDYTATETSSESYSTESSSSSGSGSSASEAPKPTPVPANESPQFGGP